MRCTRATAGGDCTLRVTNPAGIKRLLVCDRPAAMSPAVGAGPVRACGGKRVALRSCTRITGSMASLGTLRAMPTRSVGLYSTRCRVEVKCWRRGRPDAVWPVIDQQRRCMVPSLEAAPRRQIQRPASTNVSDSARVRARRAGSGREGKRSNSRPTYSENVNNLVLLVAAMSTRGGWTLRPAV